MFTGIVGKIGEIIALERDNDQITAKIAIDDDPLGIDLGASIACDGVCLTVTNRVENGSNAKESGAIFTVDISPETTKLTKVSEWKIGDKINLERAMKLGDEFGGHIVSGHVDGLATLMAIDPVGDNRVLTFRAPEDLARFIAPKGSVTLNGTSLTVNTVDGLDFTVNLIPHTLTHTTWQDARIGDIINLEIDMLARYVARLNEFEANR